VTKEPYYFDPNEYEFNVDSKHGVYIIHGFTNTTYETKDLAEYLGSQGFYTKAINLPGHGTTPEDCNRVEYTDWLEYTEQGVAEMAARCDSIFVVGVSMGSVLALHLSSLFPLNAAVFASTVLEFKDYFGTRILTPLLHKFIPFRHKRLSYSKKIRDELHFFGYKVWPMSAVNEMRKLTNLVKSELTKVKCPALQLHSKIDLLSIPENISLVYEGISSETKKQVLLEKAGHNLFIYSPDQVDVFKEIEEFFISHKTPD
jgi:carboxylesterase